MAEVLAAVAADGRISPHTPTPHTPSPFRCSLPSFRLGLGRPLIDGSHWYLGRPIDAYASVHACGLTRTLPIEIHNAGRRRQLHHTRRRSATHHPSQAVNGRLGNTHTTHTRSYAAQGREAGCGGVKMQGQGPGGRQRGRGRRRRGRLGLRAGAYVRVCFFTCWILDDGGYVCVSLTSRPPAH